MKGNGMGDLHISLIAAALAGAIVLWLGWRCGKVRMADKILHGDGGNALLARRMRAQANFTEYTPIALVLVLTLDLAGRDGWPLALAALAFMLGRVLHAVGMDAEAVIWSRQAGMILTMPILLGLVSWALLVGLQLV